MKRCFVISPIGEEGSDVRKHCDDVFDFIIKPAMDECGIAPFRSDHILEPGKITDQMFRELMSDMCIAILTGNNPNVYYELAIAQAAARPVILLIGKGMKLPFDVEHLRCVEYDLELRPVIEGDYARQIIEQIRSFKAKNWVVDPPFGAATSLSLHADDSPGIRMFETAGGYASADAWTRSVSRTNEHFRLLVTVPFGWKRTDEVRELYLQKAEEDCRIRLLMLDPSNQALPLIYFDGVSDVTLAAAESELRATTRFMSELALMHPNIEFHQIRSGLSFCEVTLLDDYALYVPYLNSEQADYLPLWEIEVTHPHYRVLEAEFERLWSASTPGDHSTEGPEP